MRKSCVFRKRNAAIGALQKHFATAVNRCSVSGTIIHASDIVVVSVVNQCPQSTSIDRFVYPLWCGSQHGVWILRVDQNLVDVVVIYSSVQSTVFPGQSSVVAFLYPECFGVPCIFISGTNEDSIWIKWMNGNA
ncbi:hypothetical protein SDC9_118802 [bioreactor metagenome]|uniref:Uncharacterized protein n=1 Tax=bioreactor metagenome TaxID=1076179 RepID=A0A645C4E2_9ZZZZ